MSGSVAKQDTESPSSSAQKKSSLEDLSRDELLKKCRSLLVISQKAKQAKDDAVEEVKSTKHDLNISIQESSALQAEVEKLKQLVRTISEEKESVLTAIENVKSNNHELQNLVRSISAERDAFFRDITELNSEKKKLVAVVDMMGVENDSTLEEVRSLKEAKRKLNDELFAAISERETFETEIKEVKLKMVYLLNSSYSLAKKFHEDVISSEDCPLESGKTYTGVVCDLIVKLEKNLSLIDLGNGKLDNKSHDNESNLKNAELQSKLNSEIKEQNDVIVNLQSHLQSLENTNIDLQEEVKSLKTLANELEANLVSDNTQREEMMKELQESRDKFTKAKQEMDHLHEEIAELMEKNKNQSFNAMEMKGLRNENQLLKNTILGKETELSSHQNELESNHKKFSIRIEDLEKVVAEQEEQMSMYQKEQGANQQELSNVKDALAKSNVELLTTLECDAKIKIILAEIKHELAIARKSFEEKEMAVSQFKKQIQELEISLTDSKNVVGVLESLLHDKEEEVNKNEESSNELAELRSVVDAKDHELGELRELIRTSEDVEKKNTILHSELSDVKSNSERKLSQMEAVIEEHIRAAKTSKSELDVKVAELKVALDEKREQEEGKMEMLTSMTKLDEELQVKVTELEEAKSAHFKEVEELRNAISQLAESKQRLSLILKKLEEDGQHETSIVVTKLEKDLEAKQLEMDQIRSALKKEVVNLQETNKHLEESKQDLHISLKKLKEDSSMEVLGVAKLNDELTTKLTEMENVQSAQKKEYEDLQSLNQALEKKILEYKEALTKHDDEKVENLSTLETLNVDLKAKEAENESIRSNLADEVETLRSLKLDQEANISELTLKMNKLLDDSKIDLLAATSKLEEELASKVSELNELKSSYSEKLHGLEDVINKLTSSNEEIIATGEKESEEVSAKISELHRINVIQTSEIATLMSELQQSRANIKTMELDFSEQLRLADERDREKRERLSDDLVNVQNASAETMASLNAARTELEALKASQANVDKNGHKEMLAEMNDMNQVLKQRGETISKQRELIKELEAKQKELEKEMAAVLEDNEKKGQELKNELLAVEAVQFSAEETARQTTEEIGKLRNKISQLERDMREHGDTASEAMSCSTISRSEESSRLTDMEDSFEERYTKLRTIAVRLKKKCSELTKQVSSLEAERSKLSSDAQNKASQLSSQAKHLQTIQQEYDKAQDLHDARGKELKAALKLSEEASSNVSSLKISIEQLTAEKNELLKDLDLCTTSKLALETQVQTLQSQSQSWRKEKSESAALVERLQAEVRSAEQRAKDEKTRHAKTAEELAAKKMQAKADSVLCLEIANYERSLADLSAALSAEKAKVAELHSHADAQRDIHQGLLEQIRLMAESLDAEGSRSAESNDQLNVLRSRLAETSSTLSDRDAEILSLKSSVEARRADAEKAQVETAQLAGDAHEREAEFRDKVTRLSQQVRHLEDQLSEKSAELLEVSQKLQTMAADFEGYKVRAQSVLRAKHRPEEASDCEEVAQLRRAADSSRARLNEISGQLESTAAEVASLHADRDRLSTKCRDLVDQLTAAESRCTALTDRARDDNTRHREALTAQKIHADLLAQGLRTQIDMVREEAANEKARLEDQIVLLESRLLAEKNRVGRVEDVSRTVSERSASTRTTIRRFSPEHLMQLVREDGEGSESVDSSSPRLSSNDRHELMPLDKLLAGDTDQEIAVPAARQSPGVELARLRHEASLAERRARHLTAVLAEAERDRDRLEQLNAALKEEIRRSRRSDEREQHAHNHEYLKNVVLKFVTLQGGDERIRLVPVLNTILRLSPEEASHLTTVAKGEQVGGGKGWGSFLWQ